jgi:hypothetical protein
MTPTGIFAARARGRHSPGREPAYFFFSSLAFLFSLIDFAGFFLTSFLASLDLAIIDLLCA